MSKLKGKARANARKKAIKQKEQKAMQNHLRSRKVTGFNFSTLVTKTDKVMFCSMMNAFRDEYFNGASPFTITLKHLELDDKVIRNMFYWDNELIAITEVGIGHAKENNQLTAGCATIYIKPSWRNKNISASIYNWIETDIVAEIPNCFFHLQIEKRNLKSNVDKFKKLGFTHALLIPNDLQYDEPTYAVMKSSNQISQSILLEEVA